ncbi:hypothetical protein EJ08DRAFT_698237 [Tothia fuscella]|uniref:Uncharacterized protein n=1 Tax=Tothia fuscella TaxID=1048955 RepID=A0A9P4NP78_9PEZI|nr:hypothetical protein EJ08DRAFT_698237 [Tothia fuscella]
MDLGNIIFATLFLLLLTAYLTLLLTPYILPRTAQSPPPNQLTRDEIEIVSVVALLILLLLYAISTIFNIPSILLTQVVGPLRNFFDLGGLGYIFVVLIFAVIGCMLWIVGAENGTRVASH